jgi:hypothetical protein
MLYDVKLRTVNSRNHAFFTVMYVVLTVFWYLWSSLKQSAVYFNDLSIEMGM